MPPVAVLTALAVHARCLHQLIGLLFHTSAMVFSPNLLTGVVLAVTTTYAPVDSAHHNLLFVEKQPVMRLVNGVQVPVRFVGIATLPLCMLFSSEWSLVGMAAALGVSSPVACAAPQDVAWTFFAATVYVRFCGALA
jgi:hypothetical protein